MSKIYLPFILLTLITLTGCGQKPNITNPETSSEQTVEKFDPTLACSYLCDRKIPELCSDYISEQADLELNLDGTIFESLSCQLSCEADWDEVTIGCLSFADDCAQISNNEPHCIDDSLEPNEEQNDPSIKTGCPKVCENYALCASFGDDVTPQDIDDAFASCMEECGNWSKQSRDCIANNPIYVPSDCTEQTACMLPEVREMLNRKN